MLSDALPDPAWVPPTVPGQVLKGADTEPDTAPDPGKNQPIPWCLLTVPLGTLLAATLPTRQGSCWHSSTKPQVGFGEKRVG